MDTKQIKRMLKAPEYRYLIQVGHSAQSMMNIDWNQVPKRVLMVNHDGTAIKIHGCLYFYDIRRNKFIDTPEAYYIRHGIPSDAKFTDARGKRFFKTAMRFRKEQVYEYSAFFKKWTKINTVSTKSISDVAPKLYPLVAERKIPMKHVHSEMIAIWIQNTDTKFQERFSDKDQWVDKTSDVWDTRYQYRVKPETVKRDEFVELFLEDYPLMDSGDRMTVRTYHNWLFSRKVLKASMSR